MQNNPPVDNQQAAILSLLAREWEKAGPPGLMDMIEIARYLDLPLDEIRQAVHPMFVSGDVDVDRLGTAAYLTPEGYERARLQFSAHLEDGS